MAPPVHLKEVAEKSRKEAAKEIRAGMFEGCRAVLNELDGELGGYAIVAWSPEGELRSVLHVGKGPIRAPLVPVLAQDALSRHVSQLTAAPVSTIRED